MVRDDFIYYTFAFLILYFSKNYKKQSFKTRKMLLKHENH